MSNGSLAIHPGSGTRRTTRVSRAIRLAVEGVDLFRGPYHEEVSTVAVNCHGCMYESKHEVSTNAFVKLELKGNDPDSTPISARGRVKWMWRSPERGGLCRTAIELDTPGNIWGIEPPPSDWLPFCGPRNAEVDGSNLKTIAVTQAEAVQARPKQEGSRPLSPRAAESTVQPSSGNRTSSELIGGFHEQLERLLSDAAETVARERATMFLNDMRAGLQEEVKRVVAVTISLQVGPWVDKSVKHVNQIAEESARVRHSQWATKIEADLQQALTRLEMRQRELEEVSERLTTKTQNQMQAFLEASRKDAVDRIVARLKEQSTPVIDHAREVLVDLAKREQGLEQVCQRFVEKSAIQIEETCAKLDKQFEMMLRAKLDGAHEEFEHAASGAKNSVINGVRASIQHEQTEAQAKLHHALEPVTEHALAALHEKAADLSREFAGELSHYSRTYLEFVSGAISELAKGLGKPSES